VTVGRYLSFVFENRGKLSAVHVVRFVLPPAVRRAFAEDLT
jgi:hypothetical protein